MPFVDCIQGLTLEGVDDYVPLIAPFTDADVCRVQTFLQRPFASSSNNTSVALEKIAHAGLGLYKLFPTNSLLHANITSYQSVPSVYLSPPSSASFQSSPGFANGSNFTTPLTSPLYTPESFPCSLPFDKSVAGFFSCGVSQAKDGFVGVEVDKDVLGEDVPEVIIEENEVPVVTLDDGKVVYTILDCIGHGGFGRVFAAQAFPHDANVDFPRQVAIKAISKSDVRFNQSYFDAVANERKILVAANGTDGDFLTKLLSCFQDDDNIYFVMRLYVKDLSQLMREVAWTMPSEHIRYYIAELVLGMQQLQSAKIIHGDLKPNNIFVTPTGHLAIGDFGLGQQLSVRDFRNHKRRCGQIGTPHYFAPEILDPDYILEHGYGQTLDSWTFGLILAEMSGIKGPLFRSKDMHALKEEIEAADIEQKLSPVEDDKLRALISKLLVKDPVERLSLLDIHEDEFFNGLDWSSVKARTWSNIVETPTKRLNTERELKKPSVPPTGNPTKSSPKAWARLDYASRPEHLVDAMHGECRLEIRPVEEHDAILSHYVTPLDDPVSSFATDFSRCPEF